MTKRLLIVGGGPAGCAAALKAAQAGLEVTLYERGDLGGVCLHAGCIPAKALLQAQPDLDWQALTGKIREKISLLASGMARRLHRAGVTVRRAWAQLDALPESDYYLLALGKPPRPLPRVPGKTLYTPASILHLDALPQEIAICGGGVTGVEYAQIFAAQGCRVCLYEQQPEILPGFYGSDLLAERCEALGISLCCGAAFRLDALPQKAIFMATGSGLLMQSTGAALKKIGVEAGPGGIRIDSEGRTSRPGVFAAGDCSDSMATAYEASATARRAVDVMLGRPVKPRGVSLAVVCGAYDLVNVGASDGLAVEVPLQYNGYAFLHDRMDGAVRLVCDPASGILTGAQLFSPGAAEIAYFLAAIIDAGLPVNALAGTLCFHPTYAETLQEAAEKLYDLLRDSQHGPAH